MSAFAIPAVLAGVQGGLSTFGAIKGNKAAREAAEISQQRINDEITQSRVNALLDTDRLAVQGEQALGAVLNTTPHSTGALEAVASRIAGGIGVDQFAINEELRRREQSLQSQKEAVVAQANSQIRSPFLAGVQGAISGFSQGVALQSGINQLRSQTRIMDESGAIGDARIGAAEAVQVNQQAQTQAAGAQFNAEIARRNFFIQQMNQVSSSPFVQQRMQILLPGMRFSPTGF